MQSSITRLTFKEAIVKNGIVVFLLVLAMTVATFAIYAINRSIEPPIIVERVSCPKTLPKNSTTKITEPTTSETLKLNGLLDLEKVSFLGKDWCVYGVGPSSGFFFVNEADGNYPDFLVELRLREVGHCK